jgi:hypothetical protein
VHINDPEAMEHSQLANSLLPSYLTFGLSKRISTIPWECQSTTRLAHHESKHNVISLPRWRSFLSRVPTEERELALVLWVTLKRCIIIIQ